MDSNPTVIAKASSEQMANEYWKRPFARLIFELWTLKERMRASVVLEKDLVRANERAAKLPVESQELDAPIWFERARQIGGIINGQTRADLQLTLDDIESQIDAAEDRPEEEQWQLVAQLQERLGERLVELGVLRADQT